MTTIKRFIRNFAIRKIRKYRNEDIEISTDQWISCWNTNGKITSTLFYKLQTLKRAWLNVKAHLFNSFTDYDNH